jgi:hypothetical protein
MPSSFLFWRGDGSLGRGAREPARAHRPGSTDLGLSGVLRPRRIAHTSAGVGRGRAQVKLRSWSLTSAVPSLPR